MAEGGMYPKKINFWGRLNPESITRSSPQTASPKQVSTDDLADADNPFMRQVLTASVG
jgi:hypothetical protein